MSDAKPPQSHARHHQQIDRGPIAQLPMWKKLLLLCSIALMIIAGGLSAWGAIQGDDAASTRASAPGANGAALSDSGNGIARGFAPTGTGPGTGTSNGDGSGVMADDDPSRFDHVDWSPAIFKLGFSFFVGFAIAFALRTFVKISMVALGMFLLLHFALQYYGFIEINWNALSDRYDSIADWISQQTGGFRAFITGSLPSAAAATTGMIIGFRRS